MKEKVCFVFIVIIMSVMTLLSVVEVVTDNNDKEDIEALEDGITEEKVMDALGQVVFIKAYLDSVPDCRTKLERAFSGLKMPNGDNFKPEYYENAYWAQKELAKAWTPEISSALPKVDLEGERLAVALLYAMEIGIDELSESHFAYALRCDAEHCDVAMHVIANSIKLNDKRRQWVLHNIWCLCLPVERLAEFPIKSYMKIPMDDMYGKSGNSMFVAGSYKMLQTGINPTPKEALGW